MIFSHRSGETMDNAIADYCVGFGGDFIKTGIYGRERLIKLKRIIDIERSVKKKWLRKKSLARARKIRTSVLVVLAELYMVLGFWVL
jgi:enolase